MHNRHKQGCSSDPLGETVSYLQRGRAGGDRSCGMESADTFTRPRVAEDWDQPRHRTSAWKVHLRSNMHFHASVGELQNFIFKERGARTRTLLLLIPRSARMRQSIVLNNLCVAKLAQIYGVARPVATEIGVV